MAGRPKYYTDEELIDKATKVFWMKGYNAASAKDLLKGMDIGQGSFYRSFPGGKREVYQKTLNQFLTNSIKKFNAGLAQSNDSLQFIKDFFYTIPQRSMLKKNNGCYLGNAIMELSNIDEETKEMATVLLNRLKKGFEEALKKAQEEGKLSSNKSPKDISLFLINFWNGINITQRMNPPKKQILKLIELNLQILD